MGRHSTWDRRSWNVTPADGEPFTITTTEGATWALRALIAAGSEGLHTADGASGRFAKLIDKLRELGLQIEDLPIDDGTGRQGFRLTNLVQASGPEGAA